MLSIWDRDFLSLSSDTIQAKLQLLLEQREFGQRPQRVMLITCPRFFGYVFNPVSFYLLLGEKERVLGLVAEVQNTFGEKHIYLLEERSETTQSDKIRFLFSERVLCFALL